MSVKTICRIGLLPSGLALSACAILSSHKYGRVESFSLDAGSMLALKLQQNAAAISRRFRC